MKEGWTYKKLGEVCDTISGFTPPSNMLQSSGKYPYFKVADMNVKGNEKVMHITKSYLEESKKYFRAGTIVFPKNGAAIATNKKRILGQDSIVDLNTAGLYPKPDSLIQGYLYYYIQQVDFRTITRGGAVPTLDLKELIQKKILVPPLDEQLQIISELDLLSDTMEKQKAQIEELDKLAHSIFYDMFGDPVTNEKGWEVKTLKAISSKITNGNTPKGGSDVYVEEGILFLRSQNVWRNKIVFDDVAYIDDATHKMLHHSSLMHNDILITKTGRFNTENSSLGRAALYIGDDNMANINGHVYLVRLNPGIDKKYVLYILISESFRQLIRRVCVGGIDKRQLNKNHIEDFPIILPSLALQQEFAAKVEAIEQMKAKVRQSLKESEELFNSRMDYYFN